VKNGLLCLSLLLLPGCSFLSYSDDYDAREYVLTWYCISAEGCEHADEAAAIDRATSMGYDVIFTSTQDPTLREEADRLFLEALPAGCSWLYYLSFFGHDLERSLLCTNVGGFELDLSIPNQDPATRSQWVVSARDTRFL
jgi:hypothetical protein